MPFCKFRKSDGVFLGGTRYDPLPFDATAEVQIVVPDFPDPRLQRWDGAQGVRTATAQELAAFDAAKVDSEAQGQVDEKLLRAVLGYLVQRLNELRTQPTTAFPALTPQSVRDGIVTIHKTLA